MTNQKKTTKSKVYDQTALHVDTLQEDGEYDQHETAYKAPDDLTEEEYLEQLASEGDSDAVLIADFELAAQDTIQEDSELAVTLTAYQQARHRLAERFRNRGFFPSRPFTGQGKGKGFGSKAGGKGKNQPSWNNRPKKTLQERIMSSTCRLCNQKGHWKAECPFRGQNAAASSSAGGSTAPTTAVTFEPDVDSLPLEFLSIPEEFIEPTECDLASQPSLSQCFVSCATNGMGRYGYHSILSESNGGSLSSRGNPLQVTAHERLRQHLRNGVNREYHATPISTGRSQSQQCQAPHFAGSAKRALKDPVRRTCTPEHASQCVLFATHSTYGVLDLGASKTVIGSNHVAELIGGLDEVIRSQLTRVKCSITFKFGNEGTLQSQHALVIPIGPLKLKIAVVEGGTPFLASNTLMRALRATINCQSRTVSSPMFNQSIPLSLTSRGLFLIDINQMALAAMQKPESTVLPSPKTHETFVTTEAKSQVVKHESINGG